MRVAVIPARGGSKRIPRKNIRDFAGKPMIGWAICAAIESSSFDRVIVSTDDQDIAEVATAFGAEVPFSRGEELSGDFVGLMPVVRDTIDRVRETGGEPSIVACIYATAAFVRPDDLRVAVEALEGNGDADFVLAVARYSTPIERAIRMTEESLLTFVNPEHAQARSQDLADSYYDAGLFFMGGTDKFFEYESTMAGKTIPQIMSPYQCQDIDTPEDWEMGELLFKNVCQGGGR